MPWGAVRTPGAGRWDVGESGIPLASVEEGREAGKWDDAERTRKACGGGVGGHVADLFTQRRLPGLLAVFVGGGVWDVENQEERPTCLLHFIVCGVGSLVRGAQVVGSQEEGGGFGMSEPTTCL